MSEKLNDAANKVDISKIWKAQQEQAKNITKLIVDGVYDIVWNVIKSMGEEEQKKISTILFLKELANACASICLINTPEVINQLGEKLLTEKELKWIIPAAEFESLLKNIGKNYKINLPMVYLTIQYYLWGRVYVAIIEKYRFKYIGNNKRSYYDFAVTEINSIDRKTKIKTEADLNWNLLKENSVGKIENVFGEGKTLMTVLHNANSSRWDDILIPMYHECFVEKKSINKLKHSENHKFQTLYPLYARLMQNRKWPNEEFLLGNKKGQADLLKYSEKMRKFIVKK